MIRVNDGDCSGGESSGEADGNAKSFSGGGGIDVTLAWSLWMIMVGL